MNNILTKTCPTCAKTSRYLTDWKFSGLNDSIFNYTAKFYECENCGLVYIENITDERLAIFYSKECDYYDKSHFDILSPENVKKYQFYKNIIEKENIYDIPIIDVGCGRGGFLLWLEKNNWKAKCFGVDVDYKSIPEVGELPDNNIGVSFKNGTAVHLPFSDGTQKLLTYFHVLEHIKDIDRVLLEAYRVLDDEGYILIEVPDAQRYEKLPIGTAFWFGIREHVYHFSSKALSSALERNGFRVVNIERHVLPTPEFSYPSLIVMARKTKFKDMKIFEDIGNIASFLFYSKEELQKQTNYIVDMSLKYQSLVFWGCSAELFSLLPLLQINNIEICDSSKLKQKSYYNGLQIKDPIAVNTNSGLIVAPYLHSKTIKSNALAFGWHDKDIMILK